MKTLGLHGAHLGDVLMALPAVGGLIAEGHHVTITCHEPIWRPLYFLPVSWSAKAEVNIMADYRGVHRADAWIRAAGVSPQRLIVQPPECDSVLQMPGDHWCVLSPWADHPAKRWHVDRWIAVARYAVQRGMCVAVVGPVTAKSMGDAIAASAPVINLVGRDTPTSWPALIARAAVVVSPDTGCVHMADAVGVPVVGLYGVTKLKDVGPYWNPAFCVERDSMEQISTVDVCRSVEKARG